MVNSKCASGKSQALSAQLRKGWSSWRKSWEGMVTIRAVQPLRSESLGTSTVTSGMKLRADHARVSTKAGSAGTLSLPFQWNSEVSRWSSRPSHPGPPMIALIKWVDPRTSFRNSRLRLTSTRPGTRLDCQAIYTYIHPPKRHSSIH